MVISNGDESSSTSRCINALDFVKLTTVVFENLSRLTVDPRNQEQMIWSYPNTSDSFTTGSKILILVECV